MIRGLPDLANRVLEARSAGRCQIVGLSGIDASGKGFIARGLAEELRQRGRRVEIIHGDGWLNKPGIRMNTSDPARHFLEHAFRFEDLFAFVRELRQNGSIDCTVQQIAELDDDYHDQRFNWIDVEIVILEAVFLFQPRFAGEYDLRIWIECPFETALKRAIARGQEGLPPEETVRAFETIYFAAQRIHFERDQPQSLADAVYDNAGIIFDR